ncbi:MAG: hypothetical protein OEL77_09305 [Nitrosopumilus sp.]|nr:hypothetical protein [Nitrosopumilus sp.]
MNSKIKKIKILAIIVIIVLTSLVLVFFSSHMLATPRDQENETKNPQSVFWRHVHGLGVDPEDRSILYIATHGDFYQSVNGEPPIKVDEKRADYMAFSAPYKPGYPLYASGHPETGGNSGLIQSTDGGKTWQHVSNVIEPPVDFHAMAVSKSDPKTIIGFDSAARGIFKTIDGGKTWETLKQPEHITALAISPLDSNVIMAGTNKGIFRSDDGGNTWLQMESYKKLNVLAISFDDDARLFASVDTFGIVSSSTFGDKWDEFANLEIKITSISPDSQNKVIYVAGYSSEGYQEVYKISYDLNSFDLIGTNEDLN